MSKDHRLAIHAQAVRFAADLGPGWKPIALFDAKVLPCHCAPDRELGIPTTSVAYQRITPIGATGGHVWLVVCATCERRYYVTGDDDRLGGCLVPHTEAVAVGVG